MKYLGPKTDSDDLATQGDLGGGGGSPEAWRVVGTSGQPSYGTGWAGSGFGAPDASFYKHEGRVYLGGMVTRSSGSSATIFTLPSGYRPDYGGLSAAAFSTASGSPRAFATVEITPAGAVNLNVGSATSLSLEGISFRAA